MANNPQNFPWNEIVLTLDGGGIRGYSSLLILQNLMRRCARLEREANLPLFNGLPDDEREDHLANNLPLPCYYFDYIFGTSTGGLIAIMLGRLRMSIEQCLTEYRTFANDIFGSKRLSYHRYDHRGLEQAVIRVVAQYANRTTVQPIGAVVDGRTVRMFHDAANTRACRTAVLAVLKVGDDNDNVHLFRSYHHIPGAQQYGFLDIHSPERVNIHEAARATTAAPTYFKEVTLYDRKLMDGGVMANNPSLEAWIEVRSMLQHRDQGRRDGQSQSGIGLLLSVGTGVRAPNTIFSRGNWYRKLRQLIGKATGDMTDCELIHRIMNAFLDGAIPYYRFNSTGLETMKMDECRNNQTFQDISNRTTQYLDPQDRPLNDALEDCARNLVRMRRGRLTREELLRNPNLTQP